MMFIAKIINMVGYKQFQFTWLYRVCTDAPWQNWQ